MKKAFYVLGFILVFLFCLLLYQYTKYVSLKEDYKETLKKIELKEKEYELQKSKTDLYILRNEKQAQKTDSIYKLFVESEKSRNKYKKENEEIRNGINNGTIDDNIRFLSRELSQEDNN